MIEARGITQAIWDWLLTGAKVYRLEEPYKMLRVKRIHWDKGLSDLQDRQGHIYYRVDWNDIEFWNPEDYHLANED